MRIELIIIFVGTSLVSMLSSLVLILKLFPRLFVFLGGGGSGGHINNIFKRSLNNFYNSCGIIVTNVTFIFQNL